MRFMKLISVGYENTKYLINRFVLQECGDFTWRESDCEELVVEFKEKSNHFFLHHLQK